MKPIAKFNHFVMALLFIFAQINLINFYKLINF